MFNDDLYFYIIIKIGNGKFGNIAIDDISFDVGKCAPLQDECGFEDDQLCGYFAQDMFHSFKWERIQANDTESDHTYGTPSGHYMLAKAIDLPDSTRIARLYTPEIEAHKTVCVNFWFRTFGNIKFVVRTFFSDMFSNEASFQVEGDVSTAWSLGRVTFTESEAFKIVFEAYDIAVSDEESRNGQAWLDDVSILNQRCEPVASCPFEEGDICGYTFSTADLAQFSWVVLNGNMQSTEWLLPASDHTTGVPSGGFVYLPTKDKKAGSRAFFESEIISPDSGEKCLQYYLNSNKKAKTILEILVNDKAKGVFEIIQLLTLEDTDKAWKLIETNVQDYSNPISIIFEGIIGEDVNNSEGQLAIDDILLYDGQCVSLNPTNSTTTILNCPIDYCQNDGDCYLQDNLLKCRCNETFSGDRCEMKSDEKSKTFSGFTLIFLF
jgi:hypothetical protein